eukprot:TRINITY_DN40914_c0_g1_i1.p1 TRINITY_DN40914_c0_g1~~TRINITY_DN40914_c0_g1_i1.p1  ORF type:complete len:928 (-),score=156.62 TRINITY_DN40914_c0_g1_i1:115-2898(-)
MARFTVQVFGVYLSMSIIGKTFATDISVASEEVRDDGRVGDGELDEEAVIYPAPFRQRPGLASASIDASNSSVVLRNGVLEGHWSLEGTGLLKHLRPLRIDDRIGGTTLRLPPSAFHLFHGNDGETELQLDSSSMVAAESGFRVIRLETEKATSSRRGDAETGWRIELDLRRDSDGLEVRWGAELRDGSGYLRFTVMLKPRGGGGVDGHLSPQLPLRELVLFDGIMKGSQPAGQEVGVPVTAGPFFVAYEHPQAKNEVRNDVASGHVRCALRQERLLTSKNPYTASLVLGVIPSGQQRRAFLHYIERERAHPTRPMLHYNSWYDIGTGLPFNAADAVGALQTIGGELGRRGVNLDAFLLDDGWDNPDSGPWVPHQGFSNESLGHLESEAKRLGTGLGVWFSPWGGYHEPRQRRIAAARRSGLPVREELGARAKAVDRGQGACTKQRPCRAGEGDCQSDDDCEGNLLCWQRDSIVGPPGVDVSSVTDVTVDFCFDPGVHSAFLGLGLKAYFDYFQETVLRWLRSGARLLKLDGIGNPAGQDQTSAEDFDAAISLIAKLRKESRKVFINLSTGTWPSPFWLLSVDTVWRKGHDHYFAGYGPARERWITYRDSMVYHNVVKRSPLFPLNSLMVHGVIFAKDAWDLNRLEGAGDGISNEPFRHEVRSAFGSGSMLQELYLTPSLLSQENWDDIATAAKWVRPRMATLADVHWFGGDPEKEEVYGWAAWRDASQPGEKASAVLTLRNPSDSSKIVHLDAIDVFDLPPHVTQPGGEATAALELNSPFADQLPRELRLTPGASPTVLTIPPFAVLVFDASTDPLTAWEAFFARARGARVIIFWSLVAIAGSVVLRRVSLSASEAGAAPQPADTNELRRRREAHLASLEKRLGSGTSDTVSTRCGQTTEVESLALSTETELRKRNVVAACSAVDG